MQCAETAGLQTLGTGDDTHSCIQALRGTIYTFNLHKILPESKIVSSQKQKFELTWAL